MKKFIVICTYVDDYSLSPYNQIKVCDTDSEAILEVENFYNKNIDCFTEPDTNYESGDRSFCIEEDYEDRDRCKTCTCSINEIDI